MENSISSVKASIPLLSASAGSNEIDEKEAYINKLTVEVEAKIFSYLKPSDLGNVCAVDRRRNEVVSTSGEKTPSLKDRAIYRDLAFNSKDWKKYCKKDVDTEGEMSFFSKNIWKESNKPCKVFPGARRGQTHMYTWMPKTMNGEALTLNSFAAVLKEYFPKNSNGYRCILNSIALEHRERGVAKSGWVFMTMNVIPESRGESYAIQRGLVANLDRDDPYEVPKTLEAVVCISTKYFKSGKRLFNDAQWTFCQEQTQGYEVVVGGFGTGGLQVNIGYDNGIIGVGALRKSVP